MAIVAAIFDETQWRKPKYRDIPEMLMLMDVFSLLRKKSYIIEEKKTLLLLLSFGRLLLAFFGR